MDQESEASTPCLMANYSSLLTDEEEFTEENIQQYISSNNDLKALLLQTPNQDSRSEPSFTSLAEDGNCVDLNEKQMRTLLLYILDKLNSLAQQFKIEVNKNVKLKSSLIELETKLDQSRYETQEMVQMRRRSSVDEEFYQTQDTTELMVEHKKMSEKMAKLQQELHAFDCRIIEVEQDIRKGSLIISGIPNSVAKKDLESKVMEAMETIKCPVSREQIVSIQRLERAGSSRYPGHTLVEFINHKHVQFCLDNRNLLLDAKNTLKMNLRFYDNLCDANEEVRKACRVLRDGGEIHDYHMRNGFVVIVVKEGEKPVRIPHLTVLREKFPSLCNP